MPHFLSLFILFFAWSAHAEDSSRVVVSIKPLHSLVAGVMQGVEEPVLLVKGNANPHHFALKPSQAEAVQKSDIVFYAGDAFETFLDPLLDSAPPSVKRVPFDVEKGMMLYMLRTGGVWDAEMQNKRGATHDLHFWLDPKNAKRIVQIVAERLNARYPAHKAAFMQNAVRLQARLDALDTSLKLRMEKLKDKPFIVFHDAYQYFEKAYDLRGVGSITLHPEQGVSAKRMEELRDKIVNKQAVCIFREPQFETTLVDSIARDTQVKISMLDPEGADVREGPDLYFIVMERIAQSLEQCLNP